MATKNQHKATAETVENVMKSGNEAMKNGMETWTKAMERFSGFGKENVEAYMKATTAMTKAFERINGEVVSFSKQQVEDGVAAFKAVSSAKSAARSMGSSERLREVGVGRLHRAGDEDQRFVDGRGQAGGRADDGALLGIERSRAGRSPGSIRSRAPPPNKPASLRHSRLRWARRQVSPGPFLSWPCRRRRTSVRWPTQPHRFRHARSAPRRPTHSCWRRRGFANRPRSTRPRRCIRFRRQSCGKSSWASSSHCRAFRIRWRTRRGFYDDFVVRSALFGFPDLVSVKFLDLKGGKATLALYSRSVYGRSDLGVNRARSLAWLGCCQWCH